jgi:hypothetical protein
LHGAGNSFCSFGRMRMKWPLKLMETLQLLRIPFGHRFAL